MDFNEEMDENYVTIKNKLNKDKIKLWLPPFLKSNEKKNSKGLKKLADSFSQQLPIPKDLCLRHLEKLQMKGLNNFKERNRYLKTGIASLKVRVFYEVGEIFLTVGIELTKTGFDLRMKISKEASVTVNRLKVIFRGKFIKDELPLKDQDIKHGLHVMGIVLKDTCEIFNPEYESDSVEHLDSTMADVELLSKNGYFLIPEQCQKLSDLSGPERRALIRAMKLHQMGRVAIKKGDFALAIVLLLEAEAKFGQCDESLVKIFENYGILNLDIVWCYLNMQSLVLLPDAEERLCQCEFGFKENYGPNLERINPFKDSSWTAVILFMRLHLLQAAVLYHQNKTYKAGILLKQAEEELKGLEVDDGQLSHLIELGYGEIESRLAIRASKGDINKAVSKMEKRRREMAKKGSEAGKSDKPVKKQEEDARKGSDSSQGESELYKNLISMGCSDEISRWVIEQRKYTGFTGSTSREGGSDNPDDNNQGNPERVLKTIINIGFKPKKAKAALKRHGGSFDGAVMELFEREFILGFESYLELEDEDGDDDDDDDDDDDNAVGYEHECRRPLASELQQRDVAQLLIPEGAENVQYDYIDTSLSLESVFVKKYKALLKK